MFPSQNTHITPPVTQGPIILEVPPNDHAGERVAPAKHPLQQADPQETAAECSSPKLTFGSIQGATVSLLLYRTAKICFLLATDSFTFVSPGLSSRAPPSATAVSTPQNTVSSDEKSVDVAATTLPSPQTLDYNQIDYDAEGSVFGGAADYDPMEIVADSEPESTSICKPSDLLDECCHLRHSAAHESTSGKVRDEEQNDLSYPSYENRGSSGLSPFFDGPGTNGITVHGRGSPDATDSDARDEVVEASNELPGKTEELVGQIPPGGGLQEDHVEIRDAQRSLALSGVVSSGCPHGPLSNTEDIPVDVSGPRVFANVQGYAGSANHAGGSSVNFASNSTARGQTYGTPVVVDVGHPYPPPRVRARGVFIIGNAAPIRIDEGIEVHLRDGVDGQVDFII